MYTYVYINAYMYICIPNMCIYTYIHTYIHTYSSTNHIDSYLHNFQSLTPSKARSTSLASTAVLLHKRSEHARFKNKTNRETLICKKWCQCLIELCWQARWLNLWVPRLPSHPKHILQILCANRRFSGARVPGHEVTLPLRAQNRHTPQAKCQPTPRPDWLELFWNLYGNLRTRAPPSLTFKV